MRRIANLLLALTLVCCAQAQTNEPIYTKVIPGDASMMTNRIVPHKVKYKKGKGAMVYNMQTAEKWGKEVIELAVYFGEDESATPDLMYLDVETLGFTGRRLQMDRAGYTIDLKMENGHMTGALEPHEGSKYTYRKYDKQHPHGAFEPAVINYAITALPLKAGYTASIPTMDLNNGSQIIWANIEVLGQEKVTIGNRQFNAWKVLSKGVREKTLWISTEVPYVLKMKTKGNPGTWEVVLD